MIVRADPSVASALRTGVESTVASHTHSQRLTVTDVAPHKNGSLVSFDGVDTRDAAAALVGSDVSLDMDRLPDKTEWEYYSFELIGSRVVDTEGNELGCVTDIIVTGANDVYVVEGKEGEILVPAIRGVVLKIDAARASVVVDPTGLEYSNRGQQQP